MKIISQPIKHSELNDILSAFFGDMIKAVVDVKRGIIDIDAELHADIEKELLVLADCYYGDNIYQTDPVKLQRGFDVFYNANKQINN